MKDIEPQKTISIHKNHYISHSRTEASPLMHLNLLNPRKSLNKAYLKVKPARQDIETFKKNLLALVDGIDEKESEEWHKNQVSDFLKNTYFSPGYYINTKGRNDLVIHNGATQRASVGVILEAKNPANKGEMVRTNDLNKKALHELVLYYLRERIGNNNLEIKHVVATNIYEWFIFDARVFDQLFARNKEFVKQFNDFEAGRLPGTDTDFFYRSIAEPYIAALTGEIAFTHFDLRDYIKPLKGSNKADDNKLIRLYKLFTPEHLLKLPFANDSNSLDRRFYSELLHIIGLAETKEKGKKLIGRKPKGSRNTGSLLENAIIQMDSHDTLSRFESPSQFGKTSEEQLFTLALELVITWVNRILFLKLLEAQLLSYHNGDKRYAFLNSNKIMDFDDLDKLFFRVLAKKPEERKDEVNQVFGLVPYLNSSLFEPTDLEHRALFINNLDDHAELPLHTLTVLTANNGKRRIGEARTLSYLFDFLNAYDFSGEGSEEIQEENKALINASVLGLIFEKINGYKDGSFFTPGFITMHMCRETIRKAFIQKINERIISSGHQNWKGLQTIEDVYNQIGERVGKRSVNEVINNLKICDPAVGSGHFLVSALNELIALKSELKVLMDKDGKTLRDYHIEVVNDELVVTNEDGGLFEYNPANRESQRVQETLFHEKQTIIENCLFGVDINMNSVKICRLRLWIELLKNAYYKGENELETLPNIDINIKCGNSLISRFDLDADIMDVLKKSKWNISTYKAAVSSYKNATSKEDKKEFERLINTVTSDFKSQIDTPLKKNLKNARGQLDKRLTELNTKKQWGEKISAELRKKVGKAEARLIKLLNERDEIESNKIYENAFEWRFEFPEVLDDEGNFNGFDVVIGNPPYIRQEVFSALKPYLQEHYNTYTGTADLYVYFVERGISILKKGGEFIFILPNKWLRAGYGKSLRTWVGQFSIQSLIDFGDLPVFEEATTYPCIWHIRKIASSGDPVFKAANIDTLSFDSGLSKSIEEKEYTVNQKLLSAEGWTLVEDKVQLLMEKIRAAGKPLGEYVDGKIFRGVLTGLNEAFVIDSETRDRLIAEDPKSAEIIKPFLGGRDIKRYRQPVSDKFLILFKCGDTVQWFGKLEEEDAFQKMQDKYPAVMSFLKHFEKQAKKRYDKGNYWWELRACDYYDEFEKVKIVWPETSLDNQFTFIEAGVFLNKTTFFIPVPDLYLYGLLNSELARFYFDSIVPKMRGGYFAMSKAYVETMPIVANNITQIKICEKVDEIINLRKTDPMAEVSILEKEINQLVYELYGLNEEEIMIVEGIYND
jgi:adenine-specific DNA-methyltransferase